MVKLFERPRIKNETAVPNWLAARTGRRPVTVAQAAEDRPRHELRHRIGGQDQANLRRAEAIIPSERGEQRHHDAEAEQVDQHDRNHETERRHRRQIPPRKHQGTIALAARPDRDRTSLVWAAIAADSPPNAPI